MKSPDHGRRMLRAVTALSTAHKDNLRAFVEFLIRYVGLRSHEGEVGIPDRVSMTEFIKGGVSEKVLAGAFDALVLVYRKAYKHVPNGGGVAEIPRVPPRLKINSVPPVVDGLTLFPLYELDDLLTKDGIPRLFDGERTKIAIDHRGIFPIDNPERLYPVRGNRREIVSDIIHGRKIESGAVLPHNLSRDIKEINRYFQKRTGLAHNLIANSPACGYYLNDRAYEFVQTLIHMK